ncbi:MULTISPECIES: hypothetical protein [Nostoc]|uniref:Uncharacterized protein n=2 Tax=Nostoc TaxID=1177 RepID=A0ABR8ICE6_9NOSO|nr:MULTISPECIES: hypothetical protein [Nostoc]MBD2563132.1 hypothetical protein [Nostoc linckia FACHB-391]MBD2648461.1 hypothetical protein [Nostoc foliaceum FACHB-393]
MNQYLINTKYAASNIIDLIMHDERYLEKAEGRKRQIDEELKLSYERFYAGDMSDDISPMQVQYEYVQLMKYAERLSEQEKHLIVQMECLKNLIDAKLFAVSSLCGALLQIAKQGISIVHRGLGNCPDGRGIGNEVLKNIIWQARNQSIHYEEGSFRPPVQQCFQNLEAYFGNEFSLSLHPNENFAQKIVINILGWNDYQVYEYDMISILG